MAYLSLTEIGRVWWSLPRHVSKVMQLMANFEKRTGKRTAIVSGHRSTAEQSAIYADSVAHGRGKGQGYRAAPADRSKHTRGAATDLHILDGVTRGDAALDAKNPYYVILAEEARKLGLKPGLDFQGGLPDPYHVEEPATLAELDRDYAAHLRGRFWRALLALAAGAALYFTWRALRKARRRSEA